MTLKVGNYYWPQFKKTHVYKDITTFWRKETYHEFHARHQAQIVGLPKDFVYLRFPTHEFMCLSRKEFNAFFQEERHPLFELRESNHFKQE